MSSKDKQFQMQIKQFFRLTKQAGGPKKEEFVLTDELQRDLCKDSPMQTRVKTIKELSETIRDIKIDDAVVAKIWLCIQDLYHESSMDLRHLAFNCVQALITWQRLRLTMFRATIFRVITEQGPIDDIAHRFELLQSLTENGKDILYFEEKMAPFILDWFADVMKVGKTVQLMGLLVNLIKFNAAYITEDVLTGFVNHICVLCCSAYNQPTVVTEGLLILDTIVAYYCNLPTDCLPQFIGVLCRLVNETYCSHGWRVMRNLLGTHMGHSAIWTMCRILQEPALKDDTVLIRGAVFYINMGLWGTQPLPNLRCPASSILPSIHQAVKANQPPVTYEVILTLERLVLKGIDLHDPAWDILLQTLALINKQIDAEPLRSPYPVIAGHLHGVLTSIEELIERGNFNGNTEQFYRIIEDCATTRPEMSVLRMITHLSHELHPNKNMWLAKLNNLLYKYYRGDRENRIKIRIKVLDVLKNVVQLNRMLYEDELIDRIVIPHLIGLPNENDYKIRSAGAELLIDLCLHCDSKRCLEMLDILEKLLNRPFEVYATDNRCASDADSLDVKIVAAGLVQIFVRKIHRLPSLHAVRIYKLLVSHLEAHYARPKVFENFKQVRLTIFDCFLSMRADQLYRLGCPDANGVLKYSSYLCVTYRCTDRNSVASPPPQSPAIMQQAPCTITYVPMRAGFKIFITCITVERDWDVLNSVLTKIPDALQNKSLILAKHGNSDVGLLVDTICTRVLNYKTSSDNLNVNINRHDFFAAVLMVLPALSSYHSYLDVTHQRKIIRLMCTFKCGLGLRCFRECITVITTCTLEMQDVMVKMCPEVLLILSKSSAKVDIAIPLLEFLSTLTILPSVFSCFVADQYMSIFAILLPYTNPFKYNHYTVFLAHHVIAVWFLKCRLPFRKEFVRFITSGLQTNALGQDSQFLKINENLSRLNQDSSDRKRSSSLTDQRPSGRERTSTVVSKPTLDLKPQPIDRTLLPFYTELTETCIDLMARYTFSPCSALPKRLPNAEFLFSGGQSMSWLLGNRVITVTTSGCSQKALKHGLCDKCFSICKADFNKTPDDHILRTSRSGSNDKDDSAKVTRQNSGSNNNTSASSPMEEAKKLTDKLELLPGKLQQLSLLDGDKTEKERCVCWCQSWAEIYVRRPTGNMSWVMRIQNQTSQQQSIYDFPLNEVSEMFMPGLIGSGGGGNSNNEQQYSKQLDDDLNSRSLDDGTSSTAPISIPGSPSKQSPSRQSSRDSIEEDMEQFYEDGTKMRNPVRRSNSSPEMSANWKNPFLQKQDRDESRSLDEEVGKKTVKNYTKDMRVSCEAIPEEIAGMGTTPPSQSSTHPSLLSSLSCPGPPNQHEQISKPYQTVPPSPNIVQTNQPSYTTRSFGMLKSTKGESFDGLDKPPERPTNLPTLNLMPLSAKPPHSPTQTSPRLARHNLKEREGHEIQKSSSLVLQKQKEKKLSLDSGFNQSDQNLNTQMRERVHTISVMSPIRKPRLENIRQETIGGRVKETPKSGINPSFVFLQLYHTAQFGSSSEKPLLVSSSDVVQRALKVLDLIPPYETHQIGVIYIGPGQCNKESDILRNKYGSVRYVEFLRKLGTLIKLQDVDPQVFFLGGLDQNGMDGKFAYIWQDDIIRVMFHVATMMPNRDSDPNCNNKKRHIGNNNVTIVYNESGEDYNINAIKGQFNFASIIIQPLDHNSNRVTVKAKDELAELIGNSEAKIVSDQNVAILARQLALHANLASLVYAKTRNTNQDPYAPNWLERLRRIKNLRKKIQESKLGNNSDEHSDFTEYT